MKNSNREKMVANRFWYSMMIWIRTKEEVGTEKMQWKEAS